MPVISVVIPVFNGEKTIKETIESILNQTFKDFELIVINDGSTDKTLDIVSNIQDSRIEVYSYPNAGLSASRNRGISVANGEYISFIDADDLWTPDKLEAQFQALQEYPQAVLAYSWTDYVDEFGQFVRRASHIAISGNVYPRLLLTNFLDNGSNPLIRKQAFTEVGNFDESLFSAEDWDMYLRLAARYHFVAVPLCQVLYRISASSMSSNVSKLEIASERVIERAFSQAPESLKPLKKNSLGNLYKYLIYKALEGSPVAKKSLSAARLLWKAICVDPALLRVRVTWKILFKILVSIFLPRQLAEKLYKKKQKLFNIDTLLFRVKTDFPAEYI